MNCRECRFREARRRGTYTEDRCGVTGAAVPAEDLEARWICPRKLRVGSGAEREIALTVLRVAYERGRAGELLEEYGVAQQTVMRTMMARAGEAGVVAEPGGA